MIARSAASVLIVAGVALGASGCSFFAPQATLIHYEPSDGISATSGAIKARNVVAISDDGKTASLVFDLINTGTQTETVSFQYQNAAGGKITTPVDAIPGSTPVGYDGGTEIILSDIKTKVGALFPVYLQYGDKPGVGMLVPVLTGAQSQFATLVPSETPTPTVTPTAAPTK